MHRLLILPHAGGAAHSYSPLRKALEPEVAALCHELPGRGKRSRAAFVSSWDDAVDDIIAASIEWRQGEWSVFGHSMGALLAHALTRRLHERGLPLPRRIFASGTMAPSARRRTAIAHLPKEAFWREIHAYGGVPAEISAIGELMDYFEDILRSDFKLLEGGSTPAVPVPVPVTVLYGTGEMTRGQAESWIAESSRAIETIGFPGHHFYLTAQIGAVARVIQAQLAGETA